MNPNNMVFLLVVILGGVLVAILFYYGARLALRLLLRTAPTRVPVDGRPTAAHIESGSDAFAPERVGVAGPRPAVIRVPHAQESGLPYASRSA